MNTVNNSWSSLYPIETPKTTVLGPSQNPISIGNIPAISYAADVVLAHCGCPQDCREALSPEAVRAFQNRGRFIQYKYCKGLAQKTLGTALLITCVATTVFKFLYLSSPLGILLFGISSVVNKALWKKGWDLVNSADQEYTQQLAAWKEDVGNMQTHLQSICTFISSNSKQLLGAQREAWSRLSLIDDETTQYALGRQCIANEKIFSLYSNAYNPFQIDENEEPVEPSIKSEEGELDDPNYHLNLPLEDINNADFSIGIESETDESEDFSDCASSLLEDIRYDEDFLRAIEEQFSIPSG